MKKQLNLSLYLVLDPTLCGGIDGLVNTTKIAVNNGVTAVQLRSENQLNHRDWYTAAVALKQLLINTPVPLIINNQIDIALAVDADGVHVGQNDLPTSIARQLIGSEKFIELSISNQKQLSNVVWSEIN